MAPSGPCGSDRPGTSLTSSDIRPCPVAMQYRSQSAAGAPRKLARRLLRESLKHGQWAFGGRLASAARRTADRRSGVRGRPYGESDTDHQQQELFVVVAARLAADQVLRASSSTRSSPRPTMPRRGPKSCCCRHRSWCRACGTRAPPYGIRWRSPNISTRSCRTPACCRRTASSGRIAARSAAKSTPASRPCAPRCRSTSRAIFPASRSGRARRPTSIGSAPSGANAWPNPAGRSCSANAPWRTPCMRRW